MDYKRLIPDTVVTTPENVRESNIALFRATMNLPDAARHCGMTQREMKMTFREFLKHTEMTYGTDIQLILPL